MKVKAEDIRKEVLWKKGNNQLLPKNNRDSNIKLNDENK